MSLTSPTSGLGIRLPYLQGGSHHVSQSGPPAKLCPVAAPALILPHSRLCSILPLFQDVVTRAESYTNLNALSLFSGPRQRDVSANQGFYERPLQKPQMLGTSLISSRGAAFQVITLICVSGCRVLRPWDVDSVGPSR